MTGYRLTRESAEVIRRELRLSRQHRARHDRQTRRIKDNQEPIRWYLVRIADVPRRDADEELFHPGRLLKPVLGSAVKGPLSDAGYWPEYGPEVFVYCARPMFPNVGDIVHAQTHDRTRKSLGGDDWPVLVTPDTEGVKEFEISGNIAAGAVGTGQVVHREYSGASTAETLGVDSAAGAVTAELYNMCGDIEVSGTARVLASPNSSGVWQITTVCCEE